MGTSTSIETTEYFIPLSDIRQFSVYFSEDMARSCYELKMFHFDPSKPSISPFQLSQRQ